MSGVRDLLIRGSEKVIDPCRALLENAENMNGQAGLAGNISCVFCAAIKAPG